MVSKLSEKEKRKTVFTCNTNYHLQSIKKYFDTQTYGKAKATVYQYLIAPD